VSGAGIEMGVSVGHEAEEDGEGLFCVGEGGVWLDWTICCSSAREDYDGLFLSRDQSTQHASSNPLLCG